MAEKKATAKKTAKPKEKADAPKDGPVTPIVKPGPAAATILSYRGSRKTRRGNQMLIEIEGADSKQKASAYIGSSVVWKTPSGKLIHGKITHPHGGNGVLRARFSRGLPGEALGKKAKVA
jgi:large subunit ribosomal protein L35Ae